MKKVKENDKFHFENGLLREIRKKASPVDRSIERKASKVAAKASSKRAPKSVLAKVSKVALKRLIAD